MMNRQTKNKTGSTSQASAEVVPTSRDRKGAVRVGIIGGAGYTGGELIRLLVHHPGVSVSFIHSRSNADKPIHSVHQDLLGDTELKFSGELNDDIDVLFLCLVNEKSKKFLTENKIIDKIKIIDLANDFRLSQSSKHEARNFV